MKVFVVLPSHSHDGWGRPFGAYTTREAADAAVLEYESAREGGSIFGCDVVELDLDAPPSRSGAA